MQTIRQAAGCLLVVGINGTELTGLERSWLRLVRPGGIILFQRNIVDAAQTRVLLDEATGLSQPRCMRCVDVEGGAVNRLRDALAPLPSAQAVAAAARIADKPALAARHGDLIARAVRAFGFNTTLAPVLDLALPQAANVLGSRSAGVNAAEVIAYARPFLQSLTAQGIVGCAKHFPGLGGATGDTHLLTPSINRTWRQIWAEDLLPYRQLHPLMPMVMINHAAYPVTPGKDRPASASPFWITTVLRRRIGYRGLIFSDDLEMGGILKFLPIDEAAIAAIRAGMNLVEICHSPELILRTYEALIAEAERSSSFRALLFTRARHLSAWRNKHFANGPTRPLTPAQFTSLRDRIARFNQSIPVSAETGSARSVTSVEVA